MKSVLNSPQAIQDVPSAIRTARDAFFDATIGSNVPLNRESADAFHVSEGSHYSLNSEPVPEIPSVLNRTIIVGTFVRYRSILTTSRRAIYTEAAIAVKQVVENSAHIRLQDGGTITIAIPGGTVITDDGTTLSYLTDPKEHFIQPGNTYLLVLSYHPKEAFYSLAKTWRVSDDGLIEPMSASESKRANEGQAPIVGLPVSDIEPIIQELIGRSQK